MQIFGAQEQRHQKKSQIKRRSKKAQEKVQKAVSERGKNLEDVENDGKLCLTDADEANERFSKFDEKFSGAEIR